MENKITGTISNIRGPYANDFFIVTLDDHQTVTGCLPPTLRVGDYCEFRGTPKTHPKYGQQFNARSATVTHERSAEGIKAYLDRHFTGVGPKLADRLIEHFGDDLFRVMAESPERLAEVKGISGRKAAEIGATYRTIKDRQDQDVFFAENGISVALLARLRDHYGLDDAGTISRIRENPYQLADEVHGIGFRKADRIGQRVGIQKDSPFRLLAGISWVLSEMAGQGHVYAPRLDLLRQAGKLLGVDGEPLRLALHQAIENEAVVDDEGNIYLPDLHRAEIRVAEKLRRLLRVPLGLMVHGLTESDAEGLDPDQQAALGMAMASKVMVISGGPGVGKTHMIRTIITALGDRRIMFAAPTGKAAKRMNEATGREAKTIHRLLEYSPFGGFGRNAENPLDADVVIIDETSMVDIRLMDSLLSAVPLSAQIIFVGDKDQLPSVGPGRVLADMIRSGAVPVAYLTYLHRTGEGSGIDQAAKAINAGKKLPLDALRPVTCLFSDTDVVFHRSDDTDAIPGLIRAYIERIVERGRYGLGDIQVLCPQRVGPIGTKALNQYLRDEIYNAAGEPTPGTAYRIGDRVIQCRNNYGLEVFNGDVGRIEASDQDYLHIRFDGRMVKYPKDGANELALAYALTVHKSQGSEFPVVIMPVHTTNFIMLKRPLLYTGLTRGKKSVVLIGTDRAVNTAIRTRDGAVRNSGLSNRLRGEKE